MVFTEAQSNSLQKDDFHIGKAPIGPSELGKNVEYVFALPARYSFGGLTGVEEVDQITQSKAFTVRAKAIEAGNPMRELLVTSLWPFLASIMQTRRYSDGHGQPILHRHELLITGEYTPMGPLLRRLNDNA